MARTNLAAQKVTYAGLEPEYTAANVDGHALADNGRRVLWVRNDDAAPVTVTLPTPSTLQGLAIADREITIPAAEERVIALSSAYHQDPGVAHVNFSAVTDVTVALLEF